MLSLAPFKYRNIIERDGGPIAKIEWNESEIQLGVRGFEAVAHLNQELKGTTFESNLIYGNPDGSGADRLKSVACYKAISEALERWAYYQTCDGVDAVTYGFDQDPSSNGMSAFPGVGTKWVRKIAQWEALERWCLVEWWNGKVKCSKVRKKGILSFVLFEFGALGTVVISWIEADHDPGSSFYCYGFACEATLDKALSKSQIELLRNRAVLKKYYSKTSSFDSSLLNVYEQRLVLFSTEIGHGLFLDRIKSQSKVGPQIVFPKTIVDKELNGEWSKYATVWRHLFESSISYNDVKKQKDYFLF